MRCGLKGDGSGERCGQKDAHIFAASPPDAFFRKGLSPRHMSLRDMGREENEGPAGKARRQRAQKRKREGYLREVFSVADEDSDGRKTTVTLRGEQVGLIECVRAAHDAGIWKHLPNEIYDILVESKIYWTEVPVKSKGADFIPDKGIILMALKMLHLYLIGASPYHGTILREMYGVEGTDVLVKHMMQRTKRGALYAQIQELGARKEELNDDDFAFDDDIEWEF